MLVAGFFFFCASALGMPGDLDDSGRVDGRDLIVFSLSFGTTESDAEWNPLADLNGDGKIDDGDLLVLEKYFGMTGLSIGCWVSNTEANTIICAGGKTCNELGSAENFILPTAVCTTSDGGCWVVDTGNKQVVRLSATNGSEIKRISGFDSPIAVSVNLLDQSGWIIDQGSNSLIILDDQVATEYDLATDTGFHKVIEGLSNPQGLTVDSAHNICWIAAQSHVVRLQMNVPDGYDLTQDTASHSMVAGFSNAVSVAANVVDGTCWVADYENNAVIKISASGLNELARAADFSGPISVSVNSFDGTCWVADEKNNAIVRLGAILAEELLRTPGFNAPSSVSVDISNGGVWVADRNNDQVLRLSTLGQVLCSITSLNKPSSVSFVDSFLGEEPPQAHAEVTPTSVDVGELVNFESSDSYDSNGTIISYEWDFDGDGIFDRHNPNPDIETFAYANPGVYTPILRVTDNDYLTGVDYATVIRVGKLTARALGEPLSGPAELCVTFSGEFTDPVDGIVDSYQWDFDGDGIYEYTGETPDTEYCYETQGTYQATLKVIDTDGTTATDTLTITVTSSVPTATASASPTSGAVPLIVNFNGSGSDSDGKIALYQWDFDGDGIFDWTSTSNGKTYFNYTEKGEFTAKFQVTDNDGLTASAEVMVSPADSTPVSVFRVSPSEGQATITEFTFDGTLSYPQASITSYEWTFGDGTTATGILQKHIFEKKGTFRVYLKVSNSDGASNSSYVDVPVVSLGTPVAVLEASPDTGLAPLDVLLDGSSSNDSNGSIVKYEWDYDGDGIYDWESTTSTVQHEYNVSGTYTPALKITDDEGLSDTDKVTVRIQALPQALILQPTSGSILPNTLVHLIAKGNDEDGSIILYEWDFDGDGTYDWNSSENGAVRHNYPAVGSVHAVVRVTDNEGFATTASVDFALTQSSPSRVTPVATPSKGNAPLLVEFDASVQDSNLTIVKYEWDFDGDGAIDWSNQGLPGQALWASTSESPVVNLIDNNITNYWSSTSGAQFPHEIVFALEGNTDQHVDRIVLFPYAENGRRPYGFEILASQESPYMGFTSIGAFEFPDSGEFQSFAFSPVLAKFIMLRITSNYGDSNRTRLAEVELYAGNENVLSPPVAHTYCRYETAGEYTASARVMDTTGFVASGTTLVKVLPEGSPYALAEYYPSTTFPERQVRFFQTLTDADSGITQFEWDFDGDGVFDWMSGQPGKLESFSSQYNETSWQAANLIDKRVGENYSWRSRSGSAYPQEFIFSFFENQTHQVNAIALFGNTGSSEDGSRRPKEFEIYVSTGGMEPTDFVLAGTFTSLNIESPQRFTFTPVDAKYIKLSINSNYGNTSYTQLGEFEVYDAASGSNLLAASPGAWHAYTVPGDYEATLRVTNGDGLSDTDTVTVPVLPLNESLATYWVANNSTTVYRYDETGNELARTTGFSKATVLAVDTASHACYVLDTSLKSVIRLSLQAPNGYNIQKETGFHTVIKGFGSPVALAVDSATGTCWVADTSKTSVIRLAQDVPDNYDVSVDTGYHRTVTGFGSGSPRGVACEETEGKCWVIDNNHNWVVCLNSDVPDGYHITTSTGHHKSVQGFNFDDGFAGGISVCPADKACWVNDRNNKKLYRLAGDIPDQYNVTTGTGSHVVASGFASPYGIDANTKDGSCWLGDAGGINKAYRISASGHRIAEAGGFKTPYAPSVNLHSGKCWILDPDTPKGVLFSPNLSSLVEILAPSGAKWGAVDPGVAGLQAPVAEAGAAPLNGDVPLAVTFTGEGTDTNGTIAFYEWDWEGDGIYDWSSDEEGNADYVYDTPGILLPVLKVTDNEGLTGFDYGTILQTGSVSIQATASPGHGFAPLKVRLDAVVNSPLAITKYEWDFDGNGSYDWNSAASPVKEYTYNNAGVYSPVLRVTDETSQTTTAIAVVEVKKSPPQAIADATPKKGPYPLAVKLKSSSSKDPDGSIVLYEWDFDADGGYDWWSARAEDVTYVYLEMGTYSPTLRVTDNHGLTGTAAVFLEVTQLAPTAVIKADILEGNVPLEVHFDGSESYDSDGKIVAYLWDLGDGILQEGVTATRIFDTTGQKTVKLTVTDDGEIQGSASIIITIKNAGVPTAHAAANPTEGVKPLEVAFTGTATAPGTDIIKYEWDFDGDGAYDWDSGAEGVTNYTYTENGVYNAVFRVTNSANQKDTDSVTIKIGQPPVSLPKAFPKEGKAPLTVLFIPEGHDADGTIETYEWDFDGNGTMDWNSTLPVPTTYTYQLKGSYSPLLKLVDNDGLVGETSLEITLSDSGVSPTATAQANPEQGEVPLEVAFIGRGKDTDGTITKFEWDFEGDGVYDWTSTTVGITTHRYESPGNFLATFRVTDNDNNTGTASVLIRVKQAGAPTATASATPMQGMAPLTVSFSGSGTDTGGRVVRYEWDFEGDGVYDWSRNSSATVNFTYALAGVYRPTFRVTDNDGLTDIVPLLIEVGASLSASLNTPAFDPTLGQTCPINASLGNPCAFTLRIVNEQGNAVRTLVDNENRTPGFYADTWDGKDDIGDLVRCGVYYFIIDYVVDDIPYMLDLTTTADLTTRYPTFTYPPEFSPYENQPLTMQFKLDNPAWLTAYIADAPGGSPTERIKTIFLRKPSRPGNYVLVWDGTDDQGNVRGSGSYNLCVMYWDMPPNAIIVAGEPIISDIAVSPSVFWPAPNPYDKENPTLAVSFRLSKPADITAIIRNETGGAVRTLSISEAPSGLNAIVWDGCTDAGELVSEGRYQLGIQAADTAGNASISSYALFKVEY